MRSGESGVPGLISLSGLWLPGLRPPDWLPDSGPDWLVQSLARGL